MQAEKILNLQQQEIMKNLLVSFRRALRSRTATAARDWLKTHALSELESGAGFIARNLHYYKPKVFQEKLNAVGLILPTKRGRRMFGGDGMVFPLLNRNAGIVNLYAINIKTGREEFLNEMGLYPNYPSPEVKKLYLTKNIIDAATLLECQIRKTGSEVLALFNGKLMPQHIEAIACLPNLKEIIVIE